MESNPPSKRIPTADPLILQSSSCISDKRSRGTFLTAF